jgi:hypothetical protein
MVQRRQDSDVDDEVVFEAVLSAPADCEGFVKLVFNYMQAAGYNTSSES